MFKSGEMTARDVCYTSVEL